MNKSGQVFTIDLLVSLFIFILVLTSIIVFIYSVASVSNPYSSYYAQSISNALNTQAAAAANTLIGSQGQPTTWSSTKCSSIATLGVMYNSYSALPQKLYNLTTMPSGCVSQLLRAGTNFNISVFYLNGSRLKIRSASITAGYPIPSNPTYLTSIQRFVVLYPGSLIVRISYSEWIV